jgi:5-methyltetrahydrofolate--homocysteine methyltransferase
MGTEFLEALHSGHVLLIDGAMGTELQRAGIQPGECFEQWNLTHPERVLAIHRAYAQAGAKVLLTNTFQANPIALAKHGLAQSLRSICERGVELARTAGAPDGFVLGDWTPFEVPPGEIPTHLLAPWKNADGLLIETCSDMLLSLSLSAGLRKAMFQLGQFELPVLVSFAFHRNEAGELCTFDRSTPEAVAKGAGDSGIATLGVNCGRDITMDDCIEIIHRYRAATDLPLFARPNAGTPTLVDGQWIHPRSPEQMAAKLPMLLETGVAMVGGCCGTTPAHIAAFRPIVDDFNAKNQGNLASKITVRDSAQPTRRVSEEPR